MKGVELAFCCYAVTNIEVEDFDAAGAHLKQRDVKFRIEPLTTPVCRILVRIPLQLFLIGWIYWFAIRQNSWPRP